MLYPEWAELSSDEQFAFAARGTGPQHGGLGHALSHIRAARTAAGQSRSHPTLSNAWKAVDSKPANPAGFVECLKEYIGMARNVDALAESIDRAQHAIRLAQCHPAYPKPAKPAAKPVTPPRFDQGAGIAPLPRPPLVSTPAQRPPIEAVTDRSPFRPCDELVEILEPAYEPCRNFAGACAGIARWCPVQGHVPRGFTGAFGTLADVELVLLVGEPGNPWLPDERYDPESSPIEHIEKTAEFSFHALKNTTDKFSRNFRLILDYCWSDLSLYEQMRKTWKAEAYLCSAPEESGPVGRASETACGHNAPYCSSRKKPVPPGPRPRAILLDSLGELR